MAGDVLVGDRPVTKPGAEVPADAEVRLRPADSPYVSRGGEKLAGALAGFGLAVRGLVALDVGASTGGFTDCLLQRGARRVIALDVGYGQLAWKLRQDPRVAVIERTNARALTPAMLPEAPELAVVDVSFISLATLLPAVASVVRPGGTILALVKPQFEVGRGWQRCGSWSCLPQSDHTGGLASFAVKRFCRAHGRFHSLSAPEKENYRLARTKPTTIGSASTTATTTVKYTAS